MTDLVLAIDQGTTNSKALLLDSTGRIVARGSAPLRARHPQPGWVEQDALEIWNSVLRAIEACVAEVDTSRILALAISNQRESVVAWHARTGEPLGPCITWQCRRTAPACDRLRAEGHEEAVAERTGLPLDPMFAATKAAWLLRSIREVHPHVSRHDVRLGTVDSWLLWRMTDGREHACDESNASRTQLFDIREGRWSEPLCDLFGVPIGVLPAARPSDAEFGTSAGVPLLPDGIPINAIMGDSHAALFGHGVTTPGVVKATYGTGSSLMTPIEAFIAPQGGVTTTIAWSVGGTRTYALEGNILVTGSALPWAAALLGLDGGPDELASIAASVPDSGGVCFVPALVGLGAPHWDDAARGVFAGMTFRTGPAELARAVFDSIALQVVDVFEAMSRQVPEPLTHLLTDGGPSRNRWLMQLQADLLQLPVLPSSAPEVSARGAAFAAGIACGLWQDRTELSRLADEDARHFIGPRSAGASRAEHVKRWKHAVAQARLPER